MRKTLYIAWVFTIAAVVGVPVFVFVFEFPTWVTYTCAFFLGCSAAIWWITYFDHKQRFKNTGETW